MYGFIFGDAGTGKSTYVYRTLTQRALCCPEKRFFLFVPEQNTLRAQQELIRIGERHGLLNLDVLSFQLLFYRVCEELGVRKPIILDETAKSVLLRASCRERAEELTVYRKKLDQQGFIAQLKTAFSEFAQYGLTPEKLENLSKETNNSLLSAKLSDLSKIFSNYQDRISGDRTTAEELLPRLLQLLPRSELLRGAEIYFDGYTGFTPVQLQVLSLLFDQAEELRFAVTIPVSAAPYRRRTEPDSAADLWWLSRETVANLCVLGEKNGFTRAEDLSLAECRVKPETVLTILRDPREEAAFCAQRIKELCAERGRDGYRYREMAVAVSDPEGYREAIKEAFDDAGIPYFIDDRADGRASAAAGLVRAALSVIEEGYVYDAVMCYLRSPLVQTDRDAGDRIDNYARALGISGRKRWEADWERTCRGMESLDLAALNTYKQEKLLPLFRLHDAMKEGSGTAAARLSALRDFLRDCHAKERLDDFCGQLRQAGFLREADENERFCDLVADCFDSMETVLGKEPLSLKDFGALLDAGFSELRAGMVPEVMDRVVIGDLRRSRFDGISVLFLLGANDGLLPNTASGGGVFTDAEREELLSEHADLLAPADCTDSCIQRFYLYLAVRKPREHLFVCCSKNDLQGKSLRPSAVLRDLQEETEARGEVFVRGEDRADGICSENGALLFLAEAFSRGDYGNPEVKAAYRYLTENRQTAGRAEALLEASRSHHQGERLPAGTAAALYGDVLRGSVTRLEQYARCPFSHFLRYGLRLAERQQYDIAALDIGNLYHAAIDLCFQSLHAENRELTELSDDALSACAERFVAEAAEEYNNQVMQSSARNRFILDRVRTVTTRTLWALRAQLSRGDFKNYGCEIPFRFDSEGLSLHGRIDRVDICEDASKVYVKVIDYKSGNTKFDLSLIWNGLQLQLVTYMHVALREAEKKMYGSGKTVSPAGLFYYHIQDPVTEYVPDAKAEETEEKLLSALRMDGMVSEDPAAIRHLDRTFWEEESASSSVIPVKQKGGVIQSRGSDTMREELLLDLSRYVSDKMNGMSREILAGNIAASPYSRKDRKACAFCPYHSVCGFDRRIRGFSYRSIGNVSEEEAAALLHTRYHGEKTDP